MHAGKEVHQAAPERPKRGLDTRAIEAEREGMLNSGLLRDEKRIVTSNPLNVYRS
jgi:hypothetical protein